MRLPAIEASMAREYVFYVGDKVGSVSLWKRYDDDYGDEEVPTQFTQEYPIVQNTRGRWMWNGSDESAGNVGSIEPTDEFWRGLEQIANGDLRGLEIDPEWYEAELIGELLDLCHAVDGDDLPTEIGGLLAYAQSNKWQGGDGDE